MQEAGFGVCRASGNGALGGEGPAGLFTFQEVRLSSSTFGL